MQKTSLARPAAPGAADAKLRQALELYRQDSTDRAEELCRQVLAAMPGNFAALHLLGAIAFRQRRFDEADRRISQALAVRPDNPEALNSRGNVLTELNRLEDALACYGRAVTIRPGFAEAWFARANVLARLQRHGEALASFDRALAVRPDFAAALNGRGMALNRMGRAEDALLCFDRALAIDPRFAAALYNRGNALRGLRRPAEALASFDGALAIRPDFAAAHNNRGMALRDLHRLDEALTSFDRALTNFDRALTATPDLAAAHYSAAQCRLLLGDFRRGWADYAWRDRIDRPLVSHADRLHRSPLPPDLGGRHVVVEREQGLGDELFFLRFAAELRRRGANLTYLADSRISAMLARAGIVDRVLPQDADPGASDIRLTVGDLPWLLGMGDADPPPPPFPIPALGGRESELRARLDAFGPPPRLGLTWRAGTASSSIREVPPELIGEAVKQLGATPVVVQRMPQAGEVAALEERLGRPVLDLSAHNENLEDMLALMGLLELYIGVSNTNQHLRVARGRTSHILAVNPPEFRWMAAGAESPWFPGTRLYRQRPDGDWSNALAALKRELAAG